MANFKDEIINADTKLFSRYIIKQILSGEIKSRDALNATKISLVKQFHLKSVPKNATVLSFATKKEKSKVLPILLKKPIRTLSGVSIISIMSKPRKCPHGKCIYCPGGIEQKVPQSYTGKEPATMRAIRNKFDSFKQVKSRLQALHDIGHSTEKNELIIMGGTFTSAPFSFQKKFILGAFNAFNQKKSKSLKQAQKLNEKSQNRVIGLTIETRPDSINKKVIKQLLELGTTRVELGVQILDDFVYKKVNRGHVIKDVISATQLLKDSGFKVCFHIMPGICYSNPENDFAKFKLLFDDFNFRPDMLKLYPCLVIENTKLFNLWKQKKFVPLPTTQMVALIAKMLSILPEYVRVMRIQRDIPLTEISSGVKNSNLRQLALDFMKENNLDCNEIRFNEIALQTADNSSHDLIKKKVSLNKIKFERFDYDANSGKEIFLSFKSGNFILGYCRLRKPNQTFLPELKNSALLRELHILGQSTEIDEKSKQIQHLGLGKQLMQKAEEITLREFKLKKLAVISGIGVRPYYKKLGYKLEGSYMIKNLNVK